MDFYKNLNESLYKGLRFLRETDLAALPAVRYEIDGDAVFALVQEYETHLPEECRWEAHYTYTDIQYIVEGSEKMGWKALDGVVKTEDLLKMMSTSSMRKAIISYCMRESSQCSRHRMPTVREWQLIGRHLSRRL